MRLSQVSQKRIDEIVRLLDKCVGSNAAQVGIARDEVVDTLKNMGVFSRKVGSSLAPASCLEFHIDSRAKDPLVEVEFVTNFSAMPDDETVREARNLMARFREQIKAYFARSAGPAPRETFVQRREQRRPRQAQAPTGQRKPRRPRSGPKPSPESKPSP